MNLMSMFWSLLNFKRKLEKPFETLNNIYISKENLLHNFDIFQERMPWKAIFPVLKSNAYWHWIKEVASILKARKTPYIVVDSYFEALKIREVNKSNILLIWYTLPSNLKNIDFSFIALTVYDFETLLELAKINKKVRIHLKIDSWMHRQGIYFEDLPKYLEFIKNSKNIVLEWVCTHFADADSIINDYSELQIEIFRNSLSLIKDSWYVLKYIHSDNSAATLKWFLNDEMTSLRLWISLYWINPLEASDDFFMLGEPLKPVLSFNSTIVLKKSLKKWEKVSYNGLFVAPEDMVIWIIPVWYYEWLSRKISNKYEFAFWDIPLKILWRVCMNLTIVDLTWIHAEVWDEIEIISRNKVKFNSIYELAKNSETITYECCTRLSETIRRTIK
ncbi:MAG: hypothetical protein ACD_3C00215G0005 [uncultured bacterium (gcode 4)]|uniref:Alanine racemase C-terminal domain-containing protein n=1 Tax=uncultured bacterium (gcode 4) TaxID=1234023 RepID=K2FZN4_9BACT|nr:MAG: hypothetical protein ACD_3C00215G0005 [uncultured bacterium (gcode 4)]